jgi:acyl-CoA thioester hydrolase
MNDRSDRAGIGPILAAIGCNYRRPVTYPDSVQIGARVTRLGRSSVTMEHLIYSESQRQVVADASSTIVVFDYQRQKSQFIPDKVREIIELLEGKKFDGC